MYMSNYVQREKERERESQYSQSIHRDGAPVPARRFGQGILLPSDLRGVLRGELRQDLGQSIRRTFWGAVKTMGNL